MEVSLLNCFIVFCAVSLSFIAHCEYLENKYKNVVARRLGMPYIIVRGSLGVANTRVYGLGDHEINEIRSRLRFVGKDEMKDEVTLYNSVVYVLNQLEYHFGYRVITCTCQGDMVQLMWTLSRPTIRA